jgi:hypothetical protein
MKNFRLWFPVTGLAALMTAGCMLTSGQFIVTYEFADHGFDPVMVTSPTDLLGVQVNLNEVGEYQDHHEDLVAVEDVALVGKLTNLSASATSVEVWMVASPGALLTTDTAVRAAGQRIWGPLALGPSASLQVDWDTSAKLFTGRQALVDEIKGDGRFDIYALGTGGYSFRLDKGALIAVVSAAK